MTWVLIKFVNKSIFGSKSGSSFDIELGNIQQILNLIFLDSDLFSVSGQFFSVSDF